MSERSGRARDPTPPAAAPPVTEGLERWDPLIRSLRASVLAPDFSAQGRVAVMQLRAADRPTILAFWATYCPPCIEEMPMFEKLHQEGHRVVGVSMDTDNLPDVKKVLEAQKPTYPQLLLEEASMKKVGLMLDRGLPVTVLLDRAGRVKSLLEGKTDRPRLLSALKTLR